VKTAKIEHEHFIKSVTLFDKIVGSVEPINRRVYFYAHSNVLKAYASDGCVSVNLTLGKVEHFDDFYVAPLDNLKLLSKSGKEDVEIRFSSKLELLKGPEYISVLHPFSRDPRKRGSFSAKFEISSKDFAQTLDLASIILREGQNVIVGMLEGYFFALSEEYSHIVLSFMNLDGEPFISSMPYESARHLVKGLSVIKNENLKMGYSEDFIGLKFSNGVMIVCKSALEDVQLDRIKRLLKTKEVEGFRANVKELKDGALLASKFQRKNGGRGYIEFSDKFRIGVLSQHSAYEYSKSIGSDLNVRMAIIPQKLNQFLSRLKEKYVKILFSKDEGMLFFIGKKALFAVKEEKSAPLGTPR